MDGLLVTDGAADMDGLADGATVMDGTIDGASD
jgi:hypothetical protein